MGSQIWTRSDLARMHANKLTHARGSVQATGVALHVLRLQDLRAGEAETKVSLRRVTTGPLPIRSLSLSLAFLL